MRPHITIIMPDGTEFKEETMPTHRDDLRNIEDVIDEGPDPEPTGDEDALFEDATAAARTGPEVEPTSPEAEDEPEEEDGAPRAIGIAMASSKIEGMIAETDGLYRRLAVLQRRGAGGISLVGTLVELTSVRRALGEAAAQLDKVSDIKIPPRKLAVGDRVVVKDPELLAALALAYEGQDLGEPREVVALGGRGRVIVRGLGPLPARALRRA